MTSQHFAVAFVYPNLTLICSGRVLSHASFPPDSSLSHRFSLLVWYRAHTCNFFSIADVNVRIKLNLLACV